MAQPYVGEIRMFAGNFAPAGWMMCQGQLVPISENETLFTLIGTTYGGDGQSTFGIPNLSGRAPIHQGNGPGGITRTMGEMAGAETVTLTTQQMPNHTHPMLGSGDPAANKGGSNGVLGRAAADAYASEFTPDTLNAAAVQTQGGSQPHENMQPFLVIGYIISLFGIFPSQT
jgi:microcystin-dependent protein